MHYAIPGVARLVRKPASTEVNSVGIVVARELAASSFSGTARAVRCFSMVAHGRNRGACAPSATIKLRGGRRVAGRFPRSRVGLVPPVRGGFFAEARHGSDVVQAWLAHFPYRGGCRRSGRLLLSRSNGNASSTFFRPSPSVSSLGFQSTFAPGATSVRCCRTR